MQIHQLNIQYQPEQDRVLARINTNTGVELRLWLTRRLMLGLLPLLRKVEDDQLQKSLTAQPEAELGLAAKDPKVREMLSEFKKERSLQQADFKTPYKEPQTRQPAEPALLVNEVQVTLLANLNAHIKFIAVFGDPGQKREIKMDLEQKMLHGLVHLLGKAFADSHWGESSLRSESAELTSGQPQDIPRPKYLN